MLQYSKHILKRLNFTLPNKSNPMALTLLLNTYRPTVQGMRCACFELKNFHSFDSLSHYVQCSEKYYKVKFYTYFIWPEFEPEPSKLLLKTQRERDYYFTKLSILINSPYIEWNLYWDTKILRTRIIMNLLKS